jgi:hypothetical protein
MTPVVTAGSPATDPGRRSHTMGKSTDMKKEKKKPKKKR